MSLSGPILEAATLQALKCKNCNNYLSAPPIKIASEDYFCGRCNIEGSRVTAYETLAKRARFPCKNDGLGCTAPLSFEGVLEHEALCEYNPLDCPICGQSFPRKGVRQHLGTQHADLVVTGGISLPQNEESVDYKRLLVVGQEIYIICIRKSENDKFFIVLTSINPKDVEYSLVIKSESNKLVLGGQKVIPHNSLQDYISDKKNLRSAEHIKLLLASDYTFDFEIAGKVPEFQFMEELECIVCNEYMKPPMFNCTRGHTLCGVCKAKIHNCPMCASPFEGGRNFVLEKLLERVGYPCRNHPECPFSGSLEAVKAHELGCMHKILCPFKSSKNCNWSGTSYSICEHLTEFHKLSSLPLNRPVMTNRSALFVVKFDNRNFVLELTVGDPEYTFMLKDVEKSEGGSKYKFVLELIEPAGHGRRHIMHNPCSIRLHLHRRSLMPFIGLSFETSKALCFKINMERV